MSDNVAILDGFTETVEAHNDHMSLFLLVKPNTDYGERFKAWDCDMQEFIYVNGWLFTTEAN